MQWQDMGESFCVSTDLRPGRAVGPGCFHPQVSLLDNLALMYKEYKADSPTAT